MRYLTNSFCTDRFRGDHARYRAELRHVRREMLEDMSEEHGRIPAVYGRFLLKLLEGDIAHHMEAEEKLVYARLADWEASVLKNEHELIRQETAELRAAMDREGDVRAYGPEVIQTIRRILTHFFATMNRVDEGLFRMIERGWTHRPRPTTEATMSP
jgi:hypothetical protein